MLIEPQGKLRRKPAEDIACHTWSACLSWASLKIVVQGSSSTAIYVD